MSELSPAPATRSTRLLRFLEQDPHNMTLLGDAANAAYEEDDLAGAAELLERARALGPLPARLQNLQGLVALSEERWADAAHVFEEMLGRSPKNLELRFNLAWARARAADFEGAAGLIDQDVVEAVPQAAALHVQTLHHLGRLDQALATGQTYAELMPEDPELMGAIALAALDAEEPDLARRFASLAGGKDADGAAVLGMLALNGQDLIEAATHFESALSLEPTSPRALLGHGLVLMAKGEATEAATVIAAAAVRFEDHVGSWLAAGWAELSRGNLREARSYFDRALKLNDSFAESHGSLAVLDLITGDLVSARKRADVARRLDRNSFSAALATSLILSLDGNTGAGDRVREAALNTPIGPNGATLATAIAKFSAFHPSGS